MSFRFIWPNSTASLIASGPLRIFWAFKSVDGNSVSANIWLMNSKLAFGTKNPDRVASVAQNVDLYAQRFIWTSPRNLTDGGRYFLRIELFCNSLINEKPTFKEVDSSKFYIMSEARASKFLSRAKMYQNRYKKK